MLCFRLVTFVSENESKDGLVHSLDKKSNPWVEKVSCSESDDSGNVLAIGQVSSTRHRGMF